MASGPETPTPRGKQRDRHPEAAGRRKPYSAQTDIILPGFLIGRHCDASFPAWKRRLSQLSRLER
ncbi:hypothetical protein EYF80_024276 [Liparis tanakae]|uniref:Uncharacterized protein n=1 Tax=Liparis tanakae TaxID=230148 RepID=A0A4Z2HHZ5_9TELE|nr:hypothetical protein EYF80_024276 [Liparis tanakae]